jgi:hypothetical protein
MAQPKGIPLRPDPVALREAVMVSLSRACLNVARGDRDRLTKNDWPNDHTAELLTRAASAPTTLANTAALQSVAMHFVASLVPVSAAAAVIARSLQLSFDHAAQISVPALTLPNAAWLGETSPIPVTQGTSSPGAVLVPYKLATMVVLTGEMIRNANADAMVRQVLLENVGPTLDAALFSAAAAVPGTRPAGILNGISPLAPSSATTPIDAMMADVAAIATTLAPVAGGRLPLVVAAPAQAVALAMRSPRELWQVVPCDALPTKTVIGVVPAALATAISSPRIEASNSAMMEMDTTPTSDITTATGPTISLFQKDEVALRFVLPASWARRSAAAVAWLNATSW